MVEITELDDSMVDSIVDQWEKSNKNKQTDSTNTNNNTGEPELPPQLNEIQSKTTEELMDDLNKLPFFMNELNVAEDGSNADEVEALKALAYEGEPDEIATNFKNQGNECYKAKKYKDAITYYTKGLDVCCDVKEIDAVLYLNRAACNLELKNYRRCINDCKECLTREPQNVKALFRASKAYFAIDLFDEAKITLDFALSIDSDNLAVKKLYKQIETKLKDIERRKQAKLAKEKELAEIQQKLYEALKLRGITTVQSSYGNDTIGDAKMHLEDPKDVETQIILPTMVLYPTLDEFDVVSEVSELTTPYELMEMIFGDRPASFFEDGKHTNFKPKRLEAYMETLDGGLVKIGKKIAFNEALMCQNPKIPLFDNILRVYFVPKDDSASWLKTWIKSDALKRREE